MAKVLGGRETREIQYTDAGVLSTASLGPSLHNSRVFYLTWICPAPLPLAEKQLLQITEIIVILKQNQ